MFLVGDNPFIPMFFSVSFDVSANAPSWIRAGETDVYNNVDRDVPVFETEDVEEDSIMKHLDNLLRNISNKIGELLNPNEFFDLGLNGVVLGRAAGYDVSIAKFELYKNNPYGILGAIGYVIIRNLTYSLLVIYFLWSLFNNSIHSGVNNRRELKEDFYGAIMVIAILQFAPACVNWITLARDSLVYAISGEIAGVGLVGSSMEFVQLDEIIKSFYRTEFGLNLVYSLIYLAYMFAGWFYVGNYVLVALQSMALFIFLPYAVLKSFKDKKFFESWLLKLFSNLMIPLVDFIFLLSPIAIQRLFVRTPLVSGDVSGGLALVCVLIIWAVIPARNYVLGLFGNSGAVRTGGGFGMAAFMMARALLSSRGGGSGGGGNGSPSSGGGTLSDLTNAERFESMQRDFDKSLESMSNVRSWEENMRDWEKLYGKGSDSASMEVSSVFDSVEDKVEPIGDMPDVSGEGEDMASRLEENYDGYRNVSGNYDSILVEELENAGADGISGIDRDVDAIPVAEEIEDSSVRESDLRVDEDSYKQVSSGSMASDVDMPSAQLTEEIPYDAEDIYEGNVAVHESATSISSEEVAVGESAAESVADGATTSATLNSTSELDSDMQGRDTISNTNAAPEPYDELTGKYFSEMSQGQKLDFLREDNLKKLEAARAVQDEANMTVHRLSAEHAVAEKKANGLSEESVSSRQREVAHIQREIGRNNSEKLRLQDELNSDKRALKAKYGEVTNLEQIADVSTRESYRKEKLGLDQKQQMIHTLDEANKNLSAQAEKINSRGTTYDASSYIQARQKADELKVQMAEASRRAGAAGIEIREREIREGEFAGKTGTYFGDNSHYDTAAAFRDTRIRNEALRKQATYRNFNSSAVYSMLSPEEKAAFYAERAKMGAVEKTAKVVAGALGAGAMLAGGPGAMFTGAMVTSGLTQKAVGTAADMKDYKMAKEENRKEPQRPGTGPAVRGLFSNYAFPYTDNDDRGVSGSEESPLKNTGSAPGGGKKASPDEKIKKQEPAVKSQAEEMERNDVGVYREKKAEGAIPVNASDILKGLVGETDGRGKKED